MKTHIHLVKAMVAGLTLLGGVASAATYSSSAITPNAGEVWSGSPGISVTNGAFSDTLNFSFNAPATVSFYVDGFWGTTFNDFTAQMAGVSLTHTTVNGIAGGRWSGSFAATTGTTYSLSLSQSQNAIDGGSYAFHFNGAGVPAVPEPETFAMLLAGLGLVSVVSARRRQVKTPTVM